MLAPRTRVSHHDKAGLAIERRPAGACAGTGRAGRGKGEAVGQKICGFASSEDLKHGPYQVHHGDLGRTHRGRGLHTSVSAVPCGHFVCFMLVSSNRTHFVSVVITRLRQQRSR